MLLALLTVHHRERNPDLGSVPSAPASPRYSMSGGAGGLQSPGEAGRRQGLGVMRRALRSVDLSVAAFTNPTGGPEDGVTLLLPFGVPGVHVSLVWPLYQKPPKPGLSPFPSSRQPEQEMHFFALFSYWGSNCF